MSSPGSDDLARGRADFARHAWQAAYSRLTTADHESTLAADDLQRLAVAAYLVGRDAESDAAQERLHHDCLSRHNTQEAARCAFWLAFGLVNRGEHARGGGWLSRAGRVLDEAGHTDCAERGLLLLPVALQALVQGSAQEAFTTFGAALEIGERFGDADLAALARLGRGQSLIQLGRVADGMALLDEVMVAVTSDAVLPVVTGIAYCAVVEACQDTLDVRRAQEWTAAMTRWCDAQPDLVPYRGQCLVHRAQVLALHGSWGTALTEVERARLRLSDPPNQPAVGLAHYEMGELLRMLGRHDDAEESYRQASQCGRVPQPGLALLRLAQGRVAAANSAISGALDQARGPGPRWRLLPAYVEIALRAGDADRARSATDELADLARQVGTPFLRAASAHARGAVLVAEGDWRAAVEALRDAWSAWQRLEVPYEAARTRVLIGLACRELGDVDTAVMELDAARRVFDRLGARPDVARVSALLPVPGQPGGLSERELEVLRLVATGRTNREIGLDLVISEHTVRRHMQNVFAKLGVSSRAAATAFALQHDLI